MDTKYPHGGIASLLASKGRNGDTMLVHMTPSEVRGLQSVALAHGGSLSLNPETGLPEASFLSSLLPTILGLGLSFIPGVGPLAAAGLVGAGETVRTGDLGKGLMAGLGAFGGAGLGAGLGAAAGSAGAGAASGAVPSIAASAPTATGQAIMNAGQTAGSVLSGVPTAASGAAGAAGAAGGAAPTFLGNLTNFPGTASKGFEALTTEAGRKAFMGAIPGGAAGAAAGATGLLGALSPQQRAAGSPYKVDDSYYQSGGYDPETGRFLGGQWQKGYPGLSGSGYAEGGQIPAPNPAYPQSHITKSSYAPSLGYNKPSELLDGYEPKIDPFTGEERFDDGGPVAAPPMMGQPDFTLPPMQGGLGGLDAGYGGMMRSMPINPPQQQPMMGVDSGQDLGSYYQSLLSPQNMYGPSLNDKAAMQNYMSNLNRFVTSPVQSYTQQSPTAPPPPAPPTQPPVQPPPTPPTQPPVQPPVGKQPPVPPTNQPPTGGTGGWTGTGTLGSLTGGPGGTGGTDDFDWSTVDLSGLQELGIDPETYRQQMISMRGNKGTPSAPIPPPAGTGGVSPDDLAMTDAYDSGQYDPYAKYQPGMGIWSRAREQGGEPVPFADQGFNDYGPRYGEDLYGYATPFDSKSRISEEYDNRPAFDPAEFGGLGPVSGGDPMYTGDFEQPPAYSPPTGQELPPGLNNDAYPLEAYPQQPDETSAQDLSTAQMPDWYNQLYGGDLANLGLQGFAAGGQLGGYSDGGRMLRGPGDGMSDSIPASIHGRSGKQPARLADGEFVVPADVVSHLGNGSTEAGSRKLYDMMNKVRQARTGTNKQAKAIKAAKYLPK